MLMLIALLFLVFVHLVSVLLELVFVPSLLFVFVSSVFEVIVSVLCVLALFVLMHPSMIEQGVVICGRFCPHDDQALCKPAFLSRENMYAVEKPFFQERIGPLLKSLCLECRCIQLRLVESEGGID